MQMSFLAIEAACSSRLSRAVAAVPSATKEELRTVWRRPTGSAGRHEACIEVPLRQAHGATLRDAPRQTVALARAARDGPPTQARRRRRHSAMALHLSGRRLAMRFCRGRDCGATCEVPPAAGARRERTWTRARPAERPGDELVESISSGRLLCAACVCMQMQRSAQAPSHGKPHDRKLLFAARLVGPRGVAKPEAVRSPLRLLLRRCICDEPAASCRRAKDAGSAAAQRAVHGWRHAAADAAGPRAQRCLERRLKAVSSRAPRLRLHLGTDAARSLQRVCGRCCSTPRHQLAAGRDASALRHAERRGVAAQHGTAAGTPSRWPGCSSLRRRSSLGAPPGAAPLLLAAAHAVRCMPTSLHEIGRRRAPPFAHSKSIIASCMTVRHPQRSLAGRREISASPASDAAAAAPRHACVRRLAAGEQTSQDDRADLGELLCGAPESASEVVHAVWSLPWRASGDEQRDASVGTPWSRAPTPQPPLPPPLAATRLGLHPAPCHGLLLLCA
ncbi:hypothetical protein FA09DRAFT_172131 [Tilletiopsis washingtonensis]|uniref:Uncharacterized protein n=1 Tax=Tilletiopsis washingtonensis TaxID=58919 RepID=A0A316Z3B4_9BASI|nr:hypothetical protein FA09DRAFT_172131 [Tilletiopsis washingtonensis]PWN94665.1 hypothetical protein FA09DRAFT_172131 [Tilletiopsis washingtonensis]